MPTRIKIFWENRWLMQQLVARDLAVKYRRSVLGYAWSLLNPLLMMIVISSVFSLAFSHSIDNFPAYLLTGNILFSFYTEATGAGMSSIYSNADLIKKIYMPKYIFPFTKVLSSFINLLYSLIAIVIILIVTKVPLRWTMLLSPVALIYVFMIAFGMALILSVVATFFRDMTHIYGVFTMALMYLTPLFYPIEAVPELMQTIILCNPLYHVVYFFRCTLLLGIVPGWSTNIICILSGVFFILLGLALLKKHQDRFILYI